MKFSISDGKKKIGKISRQKKIDCLAGWAFCAPLLLGTVVFVFFAFALTIALSFSAFNGESGSLWEFLRDFRWAKDESGNINPFYWYGQMFSFSNGQMQFLGKTLLNTLFYLFTIPVGVLVSLGISLLLSREIKGNKFFGMLYFIPCVTSTVALSLTFRGLFGTEGVVNRLFGSEIPWLNAFSLGEGSYWTSGILMKCVVSTMIIWNALGVMIFLFSAGLSAIDPSLKEAARIDGANDFQVLWHVILPNLTPTIVITTLLLVLNGLPIYTEPKILFGTDTINEYVDGIVAVIFRYAFGEGENNFAYACSLSVLLLGIVCIPACALLPMFNRARRKRDGE